MTIRCLRAFAVLFAPLSFAVAQVDRYELGLRLRAFERHLAASTEPGPRGAAFAELDRAVQAFFRLDTAAVAKAIAAAQVALLGDGSPARTRAASLQLQLAQRLVDPALGKLPFDLSAAYAVEGDLPVELVLEGRLDGDPTVRLRLPVTELPLRGELDLAGASPGDRTLAWTLCSGKDLLVGREQGLSLVDQLAPRLAAVQGAAGERERSPTSLEAASLDLLASLLTGMTRQRREETVLPGARLLAEAEQLAKALGAGEAFHGPQRPGQHWLRVPVGKTTSVVRMQVPAGPDPAPLVIALHGAGGSENLFFDGYGDGAIVGECAKRGWFLVAPRSGALGGADLAALIDALAARWPIDRARVVVVGHSMGAGQALAAAGRHPTRFRGIAALGGGGSPPREPAARQLPFFVGVGERDFARAGAVRLHQSLERAAIPSQLREYPTVEHLAIVQVALPDVFAFFDKVLASK